MNIEAVLASTVDATTKGMPADIGRRALSELGKQGWNVLREDLPLPLAVLRRDSLDANRRWMRAFLSETGVKIAPHGKTTMSPQLFAQQLEDGAWGITCATVEQLQVYRRFRVARVLFANQLVGAQAIHYVLEEIRRDPAFEFYAIVDSCAGVELLARAAKVARVPRPLRLLVEIGQHLGRTGTRNADEAVAVARAAVAASPWLALCGIESYEGIVAGDDDLALESNVAKLFDLQGEAASRSSHLFARDLPLVLSAGGSQFPDMAARRLGAIKLGRPVDVVLRSGCYITHDSVHYADAFARMHLRDPALQSLESGLISALELWAYVQSRPEPDLAFATLGKRDTGIDMGFPIPQIWFRPGCHAQPQQIPPAHKILRLNDQHAHLRIPTDSPLRIGDMVGFGISHPCTTFDKWQVIPIIDRNYDVVDAIRTYF